VRFKARDGFCPLGPQVVARDTIAAPDALTVRIAIDGVLAHTSSTAGRVRGVAQLIADVSEFMTLQPGDVLMLGPAPDAPQVRAGQAVQISIDGLGTLSNHFVVTTVTTLGEQPS
jgi:5-oxopent-3-ene-1,2,5-tricarboxylate decarboxylase/2-hydroxyhepta-2,4-diene-1,7-dioate isomerase